VSDNQFGLEQGTKKTQFDARFARKSLVSRNLLRESRCVAPAVQKILMRVFLRVARQ
jgi:hypothetical protein